MNEARAAECYTLAASLLDAPPMSITVIVCGVCADGDYRVTYAHTPLHPVHLQAQLKAVQSQNQQMYNELPSVAEH